MNKLLICALFISSISVGQNIQGRILYEETIQFKLDLGGDIDSELLAKIPSSNKSYFELLFTPTASLYKPTEGPKKDNDPVAFKSEGTEIEIHTKKAINETHFEIEKNKMTQKIDFMSRIFLIEDEAESLSWKLTNETKKILGYECLKATYTKDDIVHTAWYSSQIPLSIGPSKFVGLPGAILELCVGDNQRVFKASNVELGEDYKGRITPPKKGKRVSRDEFNKIKEEKYKEMEEEYGEGHGSGGVKVFIQKN